MPRVAISYRAQDGVRLHEGDQAYDWILMKPGTIGRNNGDGRFVFRHSDGTQALLYSDQIMTLATAATYMWPGALHALAA